MSKRTLRGLSVGSFLSHVQQLMDNDDVSSFTWDEEGKSLRVIDAAFMSELETQPLMFRSLRNVRSVSRLHHLLDMYGFRKLASSHQSGMHKYWHDDLVRHRDPTGAGILREGRTWTLAKHKQGPKEEHSPRKSLKSAGNGTSARNRQDILKLGDGAEASWSKPLYQYINYNKSEQNLYPSKVQQASRAFGTNLLDDGSCLSSIIKLRISMLLSVGLAQR